MISSVKKMNILILRDNFFDLLKDYVNCYLSSLATVKFMIASYYKYVFKLFRGSAQVLIIVFLKWISNVPQKTETISFLFKGWKQLVLLRFISSEFQVDIR